MLAPVEDAIEGWPTVELRLCVAPLGQERKAAAVLRVELATSFRLPVSTRQDPSQNPPITTFGFSPPQRIPFTRGRFEDRGNWTVLIEEIPKLPDPFCNDLRGLLEHFTEGEDFPPHIVLLPISGRVCEAWLQFRVSENQYEAWEQSLCGRALGYALCEEGALQVKFSEYGGYTVAGQIDERLCRDTDGLDQLLERQVERLKEAFSRAGAAVRVCKNAAWAKVEGRWAAALSESED